MNRQTITKFLFTFFFIVVALHGNEAVSLVPISPVEPVKTETVSNQKGNNPHTELEGTHFHLTSTGQTLIQKTVVPFYLLPTPVFYNSGNSLENFQIKKLSLLIKDYLSHNYPSHSFW
jgi:hypothetical protein